MLLAVVSCCLKVMAECFLHQRNFSWILLRLSLLRQKLTCVLLFQGIDQLAAPIRLKHFACLIVVYLVTAEWVVEVTASWLIILHPQQSVVAVLA